MGLQAIFLSGPIIRPPPLYLFIQALLPLILTWIIQNLPLQDWRNLYNSFKIVKLIELNVYTSALLVVCEKFLRHSSSALCDITIGFNF